jgi:hypothetical protein
VGALNRVAQGLDTGLDLGRPLGRRRRAGFVNVTCIAIVPVDASTLCSTVSR